MLAHFSIESELVHSVNSNHSFKAVVTSFFFDSRLINHMTFAAQVIGLKNANVLRVNQVTALEMIENVNGQLSLYISHWSSVNFVTIWKAIHLQNTLTLVFQCGETYFPYYYLTDGTIAALDWHICTLSMSALLPCLSVLPLRIGSHSIFNLNLHRAPQYFLLDYRLLLFAETLRISIMIHCLFLDPVLTGNVQTSPSGPISHISVVQSGLSWQTQG